MTLLPTHLESEYLCKALNFELATHLNVSVTFYIARTGRFMMVETILNYDINIM